MKSSCTRKRNSGQVLIVTSMLIALLLLSTAAYVLETEKDVPVTNGEDNQLPFGLRQSATSTIISALSNVTGGGNPEVLADDLTELSSAVSCSSYEAMLQMSYTPSDVSPYQDGIWIFWGSNGQGISSSSVSFAFNSSSLLSSSNLGFVVNLTSEVDFFGNYLPLGDNQTQVNLTANVLNENAPALADNFTFYYEYVGWPSTPFMVKVDAPSIISFGNGTYSISFMTPTDPANDPLLVLTSCMDQRGIIAEANATCTRIG